MPAFRLIARWGMIVALVLVTCGQIVTVNAAAAQSSTPASAATIERVHCDFSKDQVPSDLVEGTDFHCGTLTVPEDHGQPNGPTIKLFITEVASTGKAPLASPLFVLAGGPGQGASDQLGQFSKSVQAPIATWAPFLKTHDVVLVDQRGTGRSEPSLLCPADIAASTPEAATPPPAGSKPEAPASSDNESALDLYGGCAKVLEDKGIDLATYTTAQSAADLDSVRQALGADQIDLLGTSYGTWLALEVMRDYPQIVRSAILNSPVPPQADLLAGQIIAFDASLTATFAGCAADPQCNAAFPNLETLLTDTIRTLNDKPRNVSYKDPTTGQQTSAPIDGITFLNLVYQLDFIGPFIPFVAPLIGTVASGSDDLMSQLLPILASSGEGISSGLYYAVMCQDEIPFTSPTQIRKDATAANVRPDVLDSNLSDDTSGTFAICKAWNLPASAAIENSPVTSDIPTLIVTGKFDPIIPQTYGTELEKTLSNSTLVRSPIAGHDPLSTSGTCGVDVATAFLAEPTAKVNASCFDALTIDFSPTQNGG